MYEELLIGLRGHAKRGECDKRCPSYDAKNRGYATCSEELAEKAAAAIEELQQTVEHYKGCADDWYKEACDYKATLPHWIPVTERLPEDGEWVLVYGQNWALPIMAFHESGAWIDDQFDFHTVTHWMPLPEPPKEEVSDV